MYQVYVKENLGEFKTKEEAVKYLEAQGYQEDEDTQTIIEDTDNPTPPKIKYLHGPVDFHGKTYIVLTLSPEDFESDVYQDYLKGKALTDEEMERLAEKLGDALMDNYWTSLEILLEDMCREREENV